MNNSVLYGIEFGVVGSLALAYDALDLITAEDLTDNRSKAIYQAAQQMRNNGQTTGDPILLCNVANSFFGGEIGTEFMTQCVSQAPNAVNLPIYCENLRKASANRNLIDIADEVTNNALIGVDPSETVSKIQQHIETLDTGNGSNKIISSADAVNSWRAYNELAKSDPNSVYLSTGFDDIDNALGGGLFKTELYIIAARPGMGKTTLGINIAERIAAKGNKILFISLEMSREQITAKRIARLITVGFSNLMAGKVKRTDEDAVEKAIAEISEKPFLLADEPLCRVSDIERMARSIKGLKCIMIDYFGLLTPEVGRGSGSRYEEMTEISKQLKSLAKRLYVPIIALCQLNRDSTKSNDKHPKLSDLRDTGALEQDAGAVMLLYRNDYYADKRQADYIKPEQELLEVNVAKSRYGMPSIVNLNWVGKTGNIFGRSTRNEIEPIYKDMNADDELPF